ncbi:MAG: CDP-alcohol phosphatidyltransferase family protein [Muribaculaceae bacterium]|nr:CDP-alcohol phosphatidyltransferase family protein [Muribaculaceae bacterium]
MANYITGIRVLCSIALLFFPALSTAFYILYIIAGLTDIIDGWVARLTNTVNEFGAKWDTIADFVFVAACLIKLTPVIDIPSWICFWIGLIACLKFFYIGYGYLAHKKFVAIHSVINKATGFLLFLFPLTLTVINLKYSIVVLCIGHMRSDS